MEIALPRGSSAKSGGPEVGPRADTERKGKTIMPKVAGGYKLPSLRCCTALTRNMRWTKTNSKNLAQVLVSKCAEFDVHGQITQINPGPVVTTYEIKPEAGIKYSRITGLPEDLCLALRAESILIERMAGKSDRRHSSAEPRPRDHLAARGDRGGRILCARSRRLTLAMGKDINGRIVTADLATHAAPAYRRLDRRR